MFGNSKKNKNKEEDGRINEKPDNQIEPEAETNAEQEKETDEEMIISKAEFKGLKKRAEERDEIWDKYLRLYAETENARKLWAKQKEELLKFGNYRIVKDFTHVLDEVEAAMSNLSKEEGEHIRGLTMVYNKIKDVLLKEGVEAIQAKDKPFDPNLHEALFYEERDDLPEHSVIGVIQQGYRYGDKVLRPAKVKVSVLKSTENREQSTEERTEDGGRRSEERTEDRGQRSEDRSQKLDQEQGQKSEAQSPESEDIKVETDDEL